MRFEDVKLLLDNGFTAEQILAMDREQNEPATAPAPAPDPEPAPAPAPAPVPAGSVSNAEIIAAINSLNDSIKSMNLLQASRGSGQKETVEDVLANLINP